VSDEDPQGENLEQGARDANSNLQRLIEVIGGLLAASGDLLGRLQQILGAGSQSTAASNGPDESCSRPTDGGDGS
jgi:hypothetical protein